MNTKQGLTERDLGNLFYPKNRMKEYGLKTSREVSYKGVISQMVMFKKRIDAKSSFYFLQNKKAWVQEKLGEDYEPLWVTSYKLNPQNDYNVVILRNLPDNLQTEKLSDKINECGV